MAVFFPALKVALPYITQIVTAALPMFTSKPSGVKADEVVPQQIQELQTAVTQNAESVKALAVQMKDTIEGVDAAVARLQKEITFLKQIAMFAAGAAVIAIVLAIVVATR